MIHWFALEGGRTASALHADNDRRFPGRDKADPMMDHDFRQAKLARRAFGEASHLMFRHCHDALRIRSR